MTGKQNEFEAVVDLVDAVFNGYAGHGLPLSYLDVTENQCGP